MKKNIFKILLVINVLVGLMILWIVGSCLFQTITVPDSFDYFSALLISGIGVPCLIISIIFDLILVRMIMKK